MPHTFRLLSDIVTVDRVTNAEVLPTDIVVGWADITPAQLPSLTIHQRWLKRQNRWAETTSYFVSEIAVGSGFDGRAFRLIKQTINDDGEPCVPLEPETYDVYVCRNGQDHSCDCNGHYYSGYCKHLDAIKFVLQRGLMDAVESPEPPPPPPPPPPQDDPFAGVPLTDFDTEIPF